MNGLIRSTATEVVALLRAGDVTPTEVLDALEEHVTATDGAVNALPIRFFEAARAAAQRLEREGSPPTERGWLAGLPVAVKDYNDVRGQLTTSGSPILRHTVAPESDAMVRRLETHAGIPYAKTNVPEFAGGHTYNTVWGATRNPWHTGRTAGGSSGGSAAALASGSAWLATGNDLGGSLRTPAGYNGVVGVRPTPGLVPRKHPPVPFDALWVEGPMARNVADVALMLDALAGLDRHDPLTRRPPRRSYVAGLGDLPPRLRVGYSPDLGVLPVEPGVREVTRRALGHFRDLGAEVTDECPDFTGASQTFHVLRAHLLATVNGPLLASHRESIKDDIVWNIELGLTQSLADVQAAERSRGELVHRTLDFFGTHDVLVVPTAPLDPFPVGWAWPRDVAGTEQHTYVDWIAITFMVTLTACPVVALPCGLSDEGLPVGVQLVGRPGSEALLLAVAAAFERSVGLAQQLPITPRDG
ncbi:amidase family protein [Intrasporangium sp. DVR]|uniref:amidase n=1 Tax=Intrasporangium sp. DVR TaxID=3127867 RepID=UPI00334004CA